MLIGFVSLVPIGRRRQLVVPAVAAVISTLMTEIALNRMRVWNQSRARLFIERRAGQVSGDLRERSS
jgi:hypothetical protein